MRPVKAENALSRTTRGVNDEAVYVCSPCGTDEGLQDYFEVEGATPQSEWPVNGLKYVLSNGQDYRYENEGIEQ
tara:strand:+ start:1514 stop:1735 length:222 start_codon:yes stop_codon:yes gene_type:complete